VEGDAGTRPVLGRDAPEDGSCEGREAEPAEGRETLPVDGRDTFPVDGRVVGRETEPLD
jgi:hypothetical protein